MKWTQINSIKSQTLRCNFSKTSSIEIHDATLHYVTRYLYFWVTPHCTGHLRSSICRRGRERPWQPQFSCSYSIFSAINQPTNKKQKLTKKQTKKYFEPAPCAACLCTIWMDGCFLFSHRWLVSMMSDKNSRL